MEEHEEEGRTDLFHSSKEDVERQRRCHETSTRNGSSSLKRSGSSFSKFIKVRESCKESPMDSELLIGSRLCSWQVDGFCGLMVPSGS